MQVKQSEPCLPGGLVIENLNLNGYAPSADEETSLQSSIPEPCRRAAEALQGYLVPPLMGAADGLHGAAQIARTKAIASGKPEYGYLHRLSIHARIAIPSARIAAKMTTSHGIDIWNALRPFAEERAFHGVRFPFGLIIFQAAQDDICIHEEYIWKVKSNGLPLDR
jgi:hypothetical protein